MRTILDPARSSTFLGSLARGARSLAATGMTNGLAQAVLKATAPGVPDTYQGGELWDLSLVDPDNRRPVDFAARAAALRELDDALAAGTPREHIARDLFAAWPDGRIKLYVLATLLRRRARPAGRTVRPLAATGAARTTPSRSSAAARSWSSPACADPLGRAAAARRAMGRHRARAGRRRPARYRDVLTGRDRGRARRPSIAACGRAGVAPGRGPPTARATGRLRRRRRGDRGRRGAGRRSPETLLPTRVV